MESKLYTDIYTAISVQVVGVVVNTLTGCESGPEFIPLEIKKIIGLTQYCEKVGNYN